MAPPTSDVLVVGSGIAGLSAALGAAREGASVTIATKATQPSGASTWWAQGGIAVARKDPAQLRRDIQTASSETSDPEAVEVLVQTADRAVRDVLIDTLGVRFDTNGDGATFHFGQEAAHSEPRVLHVDASTGKHIHLPFLEYLAEQETVEILGDTVAVELIDGEDEVHGAYLETDGTVRPHVAGATILATGGIGALYSRSTNPEGATGDGIAMAHRVGCTTSDMEFVQFHPTVCVAGGDPFLVSEAVRGEGALLRNAHGERFMPDVHEDAELAPRDVVARVVAHQHAATGHVLLDVSPLDFEQTFPDLAALCADHGVDPDRGIPVVPAEHFLCGGIEVDTMGCSSLEGLYAVGECARTGVHGANRLASTSLLEGLVWGLRAGTDAADRRPASIDTAAQREVEKGPSTLHYERLIERIRQTMDEHVSLERTVSGLRRAVDVLREIKARVDSHAALDAPRRVRELQSAASVALLIADAAEANKTSVGCHFVTEPSEVPGHATASVD